jgi:hypothetical protein
MSGLEGGWSEDAFRKNSFVSLVVQNSFVLLMWVHGASFVDI